eukprot:3754113-Rhodomonas_salina.1
MGLMESELEKVVDALMQLAQLLTEEQATNRALHQRLLAREHESAANCDCLLRQIAAHRAEIAQLGETLAMAQARVLEEEMKTAETENQL